MADFAPYQDASPETSRALSPPLPSSGSKSPSPRLSADFKRQQSSRNIGTAAVHSPRSPTGFGGGGAGGYFPGQQQAQSQQHDLERGWGDDDEDGQGEERLGGLGRGIGAGWTSGRQDVDVFETSVGLRMDYEACLAYLLLPPAGGVLLLVLEHKSDYVRFHAWQSSLLFAFLFILHVIFSWSGFLSYLLLAVDLALIAYLTFRAYKDAETLDRCEVPFFGPLASSILDDE